MIQYESWCKVNKTSNWFKIKYQSLESLIELQAEMSNSHALCWSKISN